MNKVRTAKKQAETTRMTSVDNPATRGFYYWSFLVVNTLSLTTGFSISDRPV